MIELRKSGNEAAYRSIREAVFMVEQGFENEFDEIDKVADHVVLYVDEKSAGCGRVYADPQDKKCWHLGRLAIRKQYRGCGYGGILIQALEEIAKEKGAEEILLSAQQHAIGFYQKQGYEPIGDLYMDEHVPHQSMKKKL